MKVFKVAGKAAKFGAGVLLFLLFFASAAWFVSERLDAVFEDAYVLETGWIEGSLLLQEACDYAGFAARGIRDIPLRGGEPRFAFARRSLARSFVEMEKVKERISRMPELGLLSHRLDEAVRRARILAGILDDLQIKSRELADVRSDVERALGFLRDQALEIVREERAALERGMREAVSGSDLASGVEAFFSVNELKENVSALDRAVAALLSEGGREEAESARDAHEALRSSLRILRMETFEHGRLEKIDAMLEGMDVFWSLFDAFPRLLDLGRELANQGESAGEALLDSLDELRRIQRDESLQRARSVTNEAASLWRAARLSMRLALLCAVFTAILTILFFREK